jgi:hypothetical protein
MASDGHISLSQKHSTKTPILEAHPGETGCFSSIFIFLCGFCTAETPQTQTNRRSIAPI